MSNKNKFIYTFEIITKLLLILIPFIAISVINQTMTQSRTNLESNISPIILIIIKVIIIIFIFFLTYIINKTLRRSLKRSKIESFTRKIKNRKIMNITRIIITTLLFFFYTVYVMQDQLIFHPNYSYNSALLISNEGYESININNTYYGWCKKADYDNAQTIIYFGGNGESSAKTFANHHLKETINYYDNYNLFIIDYPSYGLSKGKLNEESFFEMALITFDYIKELNYVDANNIIVMGFSLGTGIASYLTSKRDVLKLILIAPYNNFTDTMNQFLPIFYGPFKKLVKHQFDSAKHLTNCNKDILIIYSNNDNLVSHKLTNKLIKEISETNNITKLMIQEISHNDLPYDERVLFLINTFTID